MQASCPRPQYGTSQMCQQARHVGHGFIILADFRLWSPQIKSQSSRTVPNMPDPICGHEFSKGVFWSAVSPTAARSSLAELTATTWDPSNQAESC